MPGHDTAASAPRQPFPCTQCGLCCQHVHLAVQTRELDRGDGVCRHYHDQSRGCTIYAQRPECCRVDQLFDNHYVHLYSWAEFVDLNLRACAALGSMADK
ncbi:MAG: YkgJ family cysteine cluster protein [Duganella sp.]